MRIPSLRLLLVLDLCAGCAALRHVPCSSKPAGPVETKQAGQNQAYAVLALSREQPQALAVDGGMYSWVKLGPIAHRIVSLRAPDDLALLRRSLMSTDGPERLHVSGTRAFPLRTCDYALMVAENLPGERIASGHTYSFGPYTPYETRDQLRCEMLSRLGVRCIEESRRYIYLNEKGEDISEEYRKSGGWP